MTPFKEKTIQQCEHNSTWFISVNVPWRCMFFPGSCSVWTRCQWGMGHPTPGWCHVPAREPCFCPGTRRSALKHTMLSCQCGRQRLYNVTVKTTTLHVCWIILGGKSIINTLVLRLAPTSENCNCAVPQRSYCTDRLSAAQISVIAGI